jgi:uroporphyrinogen III methyltransferase/synthase
MSAKGHCVLVGAGPGDIGLITLRAKEAVEQADVIVYDHLCNPEMLRWARPNAELIYAGKKASSHTLSQAELNDLLVHRCNEGRLVVRLKGGDPFVFGRGGEEAESLAAANISFEIIPGVSSALAVPAYAGIPVTHREVTSCFTVFTGHLEPGKTDSAIDYEALVRTKGTLVMLMGAEKLGSVTAALQSAGAPADLPAAVIRWGTTALQQTVVATLKTIEQAAADLGPPAIAVFGEVVKYRARLAWFERQPLFGRRIVVTRTRKQAGVLSRKLAWLGADVVELPTIRVLPPEDLMEFGELVRDAYQYDWLVFTSPNGVDAFFEMFFKLYKDTRNIGNVRIAAIGPGTAERIASFHLGVDVQPQKSIAEEVVEAIREFESVENLRFLLVRAEAARDVLPRGLEKLGAIVDQAVAYRTIAETEDPTNARTRFGQEGADAITFTSSSTVENFLALKLPVPAATRLVSIGPITSETMRQNGLTVAAEATTHDIDGVVQAVTKLFTGG